MPRRGRAMRPAARPSGQGSWGLHAPLSPCPAAAVSLPSPREGPGMAIKSDRWIRRMAQEHGMIEPFEDRQVRAGVISYGVSSYGYDVRIARDFKIFTNINSAIVDPKNFDSRSFVDFE